MRSHNPRHRYQKMAATTSAHHMMPRAKFHSSIRLTSGPKYRGTNAAPSATATDAARRVRNPIGVCTGVYFTPLFPPLLVGFPRCNQVPHLTTAFKRKLRTTRLQPTTKLMADDDGALR